MNSEVYKDYIYMNIITTDSVIPPNLAHVLYVYQSLILSLAKERYRNIIKSESLMPDLVPCLKTNKMDTTIKNEMEAEFFKSGNIPDNGETNYCPLVFLTALPFFEELFSRAINLLHKTKREMKARSSSDLEKKEQQNCVFDKKVLMQGDCSQKIWYIKFFSDSSVKPWHPSQPPLSDWMQSFNLLRTGQKFPVWNSQRNQRVKNKTWFAFLTPNEKVIQYYENDGEVKQMMVENIAAMLTGRRCPHIKHSKSRATNGELGFSLVAEDPSVISSLDFIAPTQEIYDHWTDAINILIGSEMRSLSMKRDMNCLLEMELRLRLLDTDGIDLPHDPPPIPLDPPNYDFSLSQPE
ncbi:engulfment and cell motility protein 1-like [Homalodisca vitripennis]|uniref:engulfment and cell motility protein 1-like n=1 Tax=Homalodisca vitripennis TaxID=197043 RepID=UPI001EEBBC35|nr:engulfment and cell motility protein 1-like [Homalodisca vitripennis]